MVLIEHNEQNVSQLSRWIVDITATKLGLLNDSFRIWLYRCQMYTALMWSIAGWLWPIWSMRRYRNHHVSCVLSVSQMRHIYKSWSRAFDTCYWIIGSLLWPWPQLCSRVPSLDPGFQSKDTKRVCPLQMSLTTLWAEVTVSWRKKDKSGKQSSKKGNF